jgi:excisionase family DNA binding protein
MPNKSAKSSAPNGAKHSPAAIPVGAYKLKPAAEYLGGLSVPTMYRLIERGLLKPCRATRHLLFPKKELDRFLAT